MELQLEDKRALWPYWLFLAPAMRDSLTSGKEIARDLGNSMRNKQAGHLQLEVAASIEDRTLSRTSPEIAEHRYGCGSAAPEKVRHEL